VFDFVEDFWRYYTGRIENRTERRAERTERTQAEKEHSKNNDLAKNLLSA
jgi:hypothetical protein